MKIKAGPSRVKVAYGYRQTETMVMKVEGKNCRFECRPDY